MKKLNIFEKEEKRQKHKHAFEHNFRDLPEDILKKLKLSDLISIGNKLPSLFVGPQI